MPVTEDSRLEVPWIAFPNDEASLHRVHRRGSEGLLLKVRRSEDLARIKELVSPFGFWRIACQNALYLPCPTDLLTQSMMEELAQVLGGQITHLPPASLTSEPTCIDEEAEHVQLQSEWIKFLGLNAEGHEIFSYVTGNRYRKLQSKEGESSFHVEKPERPHSYYLRVASLNDIKALAAGVLLSALKHRINAIDLERLVDTALEPFQANQAELDAHEVTNHLKSELVTQILQVVTQKKGDRKNYHKAMQMALHLNDVIEDEEPENDGFTPNVQFLIFLRRLTQEYGDVDFSGNSKLALGLPFVKTKDRPRLQVCDWTEAALSGLIERVANTLECRREKGRSIFLLAGEMLAESDRFRHEIGRSYSFEIVAQLQPQVVTRQRTEQPITMIVVGDKRGSYQETAPQAVHRTEFVETTADLDSVYQEILRSRRRIAEWEAEIDQAEDHSYQENERQRVYEAQSKASRSFTMIPKALEAPTAKAMKRVVRRYGHDLDRQVADWMGISKGELSKRLLAEQVDAIAMAMEATERNRGFLLADQTGIGKGRTLAALAFIAARAGKKVIYFTENTEINIPDVWRDMKAVGALGHLQPLIIASKSVELKWDGVPDDLLKPEPVRTMPAREKNELFQSGQWPSAHNLILTNYSQFRGKKDAPSSMWAKSALQSDTLIILDESQNAINPNTRTGAVIRSMIKKVGRSNVLFATATPMRDKHSADLYKPLLPNIEGYRLNHILDMKFTGGESAQESFTSMLAEDGVYLRRDHDLSNIDFQVRLPDDATMSTYLAEMDKFSPLAEKVMDCTLEINHFQHQQAGIIYAQLIEEGVSRAKAKAEVEDSIRVHSPGGPMTRLARLMINALKVDQVVREVVNELKEGRKPLITFHSTGESLLSELIAEDTGLGRDTEIHLTLLDQVRRVTESMFKNKSEDEGDFDFRDESEDIRQHGLELDDLVDRINPELPAFPIDRIVEQLAAQGISAGEISGRNLAYRDNRIVRRRNSGRYETIRQFNSGELDVLIYNMAGATGGSYHASPEFRDQRPRTLIEMETPLDIIKYVQAQGRSNRYGQVSRPRVVSVMTGLASEMRILQQRNRKLRAMGASVDGNRSHPLLVDDVPDFLNPIGDRSARQVLEANPRLAHKLGFSLGTQMEEAATGGFANKVLSRSIVLSSNAQNDLIDLIRYEFDATIEELNSQNANPLKPQEIPGHMEIKARTLYEGKEITDDDPDRSSFLSPLYIETGIHHYNEKPISSDELRIMVNQSIITDGAEGFKAYAHTLATNFPNYMQDLLDASMTFEEAVDRIDEQSYAFVIRFTRLQLLHHLLSHIKPGIVIQFDRTWGGKDNSLRTVVKLFGPKMQHAHLPQAYRIKTVEPGDAKPRLTALNKLMAFNKASIRFQIGLSQGDNLRHLQDFSQQSVQERNFPIQILTGNHLAAVREADSHHLGALSLYRDMAGTIHRGVVIHRSARDLSRLPVMVPSSRVAKALTSLFMTGRLAETFLVFNISVGSKTLGTMVLSHRLPGQDLSGRFRFPLEDIQFGPDGEEIFDEESFYYKHQELGRLFRRNPSSPRSSLDGQDLFLSENREIFEIVFSSLDDLPVYCSHWHRDQVTEIIDNLEKGNILDEYQSFLPIQ